MVEERTFPGPDGGRLTYRELGTGRPVVLLHGFTATGATWFDAGPAHALAERGRRVIVPDLRGHGSSAAPDDPAAYPPDVLTDDLLTLVRHLGLDEETGGYDLAGYSLGGRVVLRALVRGARPRRAVVAGQGLRAVTGPLDQRGLFRRTLDALLAGTPPPLDSPEGGTAAWIRRSGNDPRALRHVLDTPLPITRSELAVVPTPVLVLVGADDEHQAPTAPALADALLHGRHAEVPGDHVSALGTPQLHTAVLRFLAEDPESPTGGP
jgi:pimeloyl-ACP methyl ester carboxylesterase